MQNYGSLDLNLKSMEENEYYFIIIIKGMWIKKLIKWKKYIEWKWVKPQWSNSKYITCILQNCDIGI